jgi:hypothetical protein
MPRRDAEASAGHRVTAGPFFNLWSHTDVAPMAARDAACKVRLVKSPDSHQMNVASFTTLWQKAAQTRRLVPLCTSSDLTLTFSNFSTVLRSHS